MCEVLGSLLLAQINECIFPNLGGWTFFAKCFSLFLFLFILLDKVSRMGHILKVRLYCNWFKVKLYIINIRVDF